jgi:hypothetical protein
VDAQVGQFREERDRFVRALRQAAAQAQTGS